MSTPEKGETSAGPTPRRILAATDLSEPAAEAIRQASAQALAVNGALGVCHVLPSLGVHMLFPQHYAREAIEAASLSERAAERVSQSVTAMTGRSPGEYEVFIEHGTDYAEIVRRAESWGAALVVVGGRTGSGATLSLLGNVAEKVVRYAPRSVLVARPADERGLVIAATDLSEASVPAIEAAVVEARRRNAKLTVLHVVDQGVPLASVALSMGYTPLVLSPELLEEFRRRGRATIDETLAKLGARAQVTIAEGHAAPTILRYSAEHHPELIVVGTRGRTGLARVALGSVAEHVMRSATTSVLVVRPTGRG
jgi:universal stress protein E